MILYVLDKLWERVLLNSFRFFMQHWLNDSKIRIDHVITILLSIGAGVEHVFDVLDRILYALAAGFLGPWQTVDHDIDIMFGRLFALFYEHAKLSIDLHLIAERERLHQTVNVPRVVDGFTEQNSIPIQQVRFNNAFFHVEDKVVSVLHCTDRSAAIRAVIASGAILLEI